MNAKNLRWLAVALPITVCLSSNANVFSSAKDNKETVSTASDTKSGETPSVDIKTGETKSDAANSAETSTDAAVKYSTKTGDAATGETKSDGANPFESHELGVTSGADASETGTATTTTTTATPPTKPNEPPPPTEEQLKKRNEAFGKAAQFMAKKKYDDAIKAFDSAWKSGGDSGEALIYMGSCYYSKKQYPQALKQYQLASVKGTNFKTRHKAEGMAARLASYMRGVCPDTCLKASTPGWQHRDAAGHPSKELWMHFRYSDSKGSGTVAYSQNHIGEKIGRVNGVPKSIGKCPTCGGTGRVSLP